MSARFAIGAAFVLGLPVATGFAARAPLPAHSPAHVAWSSASAQMRPHTFRGGSARRARSLLLQAAADGNGSANELQRNIASDTVYESVSVARPGWKVVAACTVGAALALYALYLEGAASAAAAAAKSFKAGCDFGGAASCSSVATSAYAKGLGLINPRGPFGFLALPNAVYGLWCAAPHPDPTWRFPARTETRCRSRSRAERVCGRPQLLRRDGALAAPGRLRRAPRACPRAPACGRRGALLCLPWLRAPLCAPKSLRRLCRHLPRERGPRASPETRRAPRGLTASLPHCLTASPSRRPAPRARRSSGSRCRTTARCCARS
jgi:hypothetical protein